MVQRLNIPAVQQQTVLEVQWSDCPDDVYEEVAEKIWRDAEFGNDNYYFSWSSNGWHPESYPITAAYLAERGIEKCLIHYWW